MPKTKIKVNPKAFVEDYRKGMTDDQLMLLHGLDERTLRHVIHLLVAKNLLDASEIRERVSLAPVETGEDYTLAVHDSSYRVVEHPGLPREEKGESPIGTRCPQCGAQVSERMLTCPECGHVLPGEERWTSKEKKTGLFGRLPPRIVGYVIALLCAGVLFLVFKYFLFPITTVGRERTQVAKKGASTQVISIPPESTQVEPAPPPVEEDGETTARPIDSLKERLIDEGVFADVSEDFTAITTGDRWTVLSKEEQLRYLFVIYEAMRMSGMEGTFEVVNPFGQIVARTTGNSLIFADPDTGSQQVISFGDREAPSKR